jgi:carboxymethylenebutenolidase
MDEQLKSRAIALHDRFTHDGMDRRAFMAELTMLTGSAAAASALLAGIAADPAAAAIVAEDDPLVRTSEPRWAVAGGRTMSGYLAEPRNAAGPLPRLVVIHENRGLNAHIRDIARRFAVAGFSALAPDFLSPSGGTPADEDAARAAIGKLDLTSTVADGVATLSAARAWEGGTGNIGAVGFCWGGGMVNRLAVAAGPALDAGVCFYGPAPDPREASKVSAPLLLHLAELDERVNATALPWAEALRNKGHSVTSIVYPGVNHAFHNDTSVERYNKEAAAKAWNTTVDFFRKYLS